MDELAHLSPISAKECLDANAGHFFGISHYSFALLFLPIFPAIPQQNQALLIQLFGGATTSSEVTHGFGDIESSCPVPDRGLLGKQRERVSLSVP